MASRTIDSLGTRHFPLQECPFEIFRCILAVLEGDQATLRTCTLISHLWMNVARPLLFATAVIELHRFQEPFAAFTDFIDSHPELAYAIKSLNIWDKCWDHTTVGLSDVVSVIRKLPTLQSLSLLEVTIRDDENYDGPPYPLERLQVDSCMIRALPGCPVLLPHSILSRFSPKRLNYRDNPRATPVVPQRILTRHSIRTLDCDLIDDTTSQVLQSYLLPGHLRTFSTNINTLHFIPRTHDFLSELGANLVNLELNLCTILILGTFAQEPFREFNWGPLGTLISSLTKLESVALVVPSCRYMDYERSADEFADRYEFFSHIFDPRLSLPSSLRSITVRFDQWQDTRLEYRSYDARVRADPVELYDIPTMDRTLSRARCPSLQDVTVEIDVRPNGHPEAIRAVVVEALPVLWEAGLLKFAERLSGPPREQCNPYD